MTSLMLEATNGISCLLYRGLVDVGAGERRATILINQQHLSWICFKARLEAELLLRLIVTQQ